VSVARRTTPPAGADLAHSRNKGDTLVTSTTALGKLRSRALFGGQALIALAILTLSTGATPAGASQSGGGWIEPQAGSWHSWVLTTGSQIRPDPPPDAEGTRAELDRLRELAQQRDGTTLDQIEFWDTGAPSYRWNELSVNEALKHNLGANYATRALALVHVALSDAMVATWDAKYAYQRRRPSDLDPSMTTVVATPASPSYPSEHAAAAAAASAVLAYLFPDEGSLFADKADEASRSRLMAGVQYTSDIVAGQELGRAVAALVINRAQHDGSDAQWTGTVPTEPGHWSGSNPILPLAGTWKTWALASGSELRPGPPLAYDSPEEAADLAVINNFQRTPKSNSDALFWEYGSGGTRNYWFWNEQANKKILEYRLDADPPRAARAYAVESIAIYDSAVACWDAKYTYWAIRPFQLDPSLKTLFPTPNHPSYPAAHGCLSSAAAGALGLLFPRDAQTLNALADEAGQSRIWAGIHFPTDVRAGLALGRGVAQKVIDQVQSDDVP
jgi:membrane-associated phospholipid phosphatase